MDGRASRGPRRAVGHTRQSTAEDSGGRARGRFWTHPELTSWCRALGGPRGPRGRFSTQVMFWTHPNLASWWNVLDTPRSRQLVECFGGIQIRPVGDGALVPFYPRPAGCGPPRGAPGEPFGTQAKFSTWANSWTYLNFWTYPNLASWRPGFLDIPKSGQLVHPGYQPGVSVRQHSYDPA